MLLYLNINGRVRKVLMQAPKNGFFYVLDRITGELISAEPFVKVSWASAIGKDGRPVVNPAAYYDQEGIAIYPTGGGEGVACPHGLVVSGARVAVWSFILRAEH